MRSFALFVAALAISSASALVTGSSIWPRQIPSSVGCETACGNAATVSTDCAQKNTNTTFICSCSDDFVNALRDCYQCAINVAGSSFSADSANRALKNYADGCATAGQPVGTPTVDAASGSGGSSGSSGSTGSSPPNNNSGEKLALGVSALLGVTGVLLSLY